MTQQLLLFGANGQLGARLKTVLSEQYEVTAIDRKACDLRHVDEKKIEVMLRAVEPAMVINAAAYTAVDQAESDQEEATYINATVPGFLARATQAYQIPFLHFSTDYVFDGGRGAPYREDAATHPLNIYGASKQAGEEAVLQAGGHIIRLQWVYDTRGKNFFLTMQKLLAERDQLRVVADQLGAPSFAGDIAACVQQFVLRLQAKEIPSGIYHLAAGGVTSWHGFACAIAEEIHATIQITPILSSEYPQAATRPKDTRLDCAALAAYGIRMPHWREGLRAAILEQ